MAASTRSAGGQCWRAITRQATPQRPASSSLPLSRKAHPSSSRLPQQACFNTSTRLRQSEQPSPPPPHDMRAMTQPPPTDLDLKQPSETWTNPNVDFPFEGDKPGTGEPDVKQKIEDDLFGLAKARNIPIPPSLTAHPLNPASARLPRSVQTLYVQPLKRPQTHGIPVADLQLRSYSARNLEYLADLALRAAYYLNLPARGPIPLPRITERWTVPRSVFAHKKSQENWERITMRRLVQIVDGDPGVVQRWLAFVRKWSWYGVGMKANVWTFESLPEQMEGKEREERQKEEVERGMESVDWSLFGRREGMEGTKEVAELLERQGFGKGTISEALQAVGGEGGGAFSAKRLKEGKKVRRTMDEEGDVREYKSKMADLARVRSYQEY